MQQPVTMQPAPGAGMAVLPVGTRGWSSGIMGCLDDVPICMCGWLFPVCLQCRIAQGLGESSLTVLCVPGAMISYRQKLRIITGIQGDLCTDCVNSSMCGPFEACRIAREMKQVGLYPQ